MLLRLRNKLNREFPVIEYTTYDEDSNVIKYIAIDLKNKSYVSELFLGNQLIRIDTNRFDFSQKYRILFDAEGNKIYSVYENDEQLSFKHPSIDIDLSINGILVTIEMTKKGQRRPYGR